MTLLRKTTQFVLPVEKPETGVNQYDIYPAHDLGEEKIFCDYMSLARRIAGSKRVIIDGYVGVRFDIFSRELNKADRKSTRLNSSHYQQSRMPSSA